MSLISALITVEPMPHRDRSALMALDSSLTRTRFSTLSLNTLGAAFARKKRKKKKKKKREKNTKVSQNLQSSHCHTMTEGS
jgi:hypothetical protein